MIEGKYLFELYPDYSKEKIINAIKMLSQNQKNLLIKAFGINLDNKAELKAFNKIEKEILYTTISKSLIALLENDEEKTTQEVYLTNDIIKDTFNKLEYKPLSKKQETVWLKKLKLSYYYDVNSEMKEKYFYYYCEVYPQFKKKYEKSSEKEKELLLKKAIEKATIEREKFIKNNERLIIATINKYDNPILREELFQEGNIGLIKAVEKFDVEAENKFSTYAVWWIKHYTTRYITNNTETIRLPANSYTKQRQILKKSYELYEKLHRKPTIEELSAETGIPSKTIKELIIYTEYYTNPISINYSEDNDDETLENYISDKESDFENKIIDKQIVKQLKEIIDDLDPIAKKVIYMRMGLYDKHPYTLDEIAKNIKQSREKIRKIELKALNIIRKEFKKRNTKKEIILPLNQNEQLFNNEELSEKEKINLTIEEIAKLDYTSMQIIYLKYKLQFSNKAICKTLNITENYLIEKEKNILTELKEKLKEEKRKKEVLIIKRKIKK